MPLHSLARKQPDRNLEGILAHHALRSFDDARVEIEQNILASAGKSASKPANDDYSFRTKSYSAPTYGSQFVSYAMGNAYHERFVRNDVNDSYNGLSQLSWAIHRADLESRRSSASASRVEIELSSMVELRGIEPLCGKVSHSDVSKLIHASYLVTLKA